jgi:hypothetical protein
MQNMEMRFKAARALIESFGWGAEDVKTHRIYDCDRDTGHCWHEVGHYNGLDTDVYLHINERECSYDKILFEVAVFAIRLGVCVGWVPLVVNLTDFAVHNPIPEIEIPRLLEKQVYTSRNSFNNLEYAAKYRRKSWEEVRKLGCPYELLSEGRTYTLIETVVDSAADSPTVGTFTIEGKS